MSEYVQYTIVSDTSWGN